MAASQLGMAASADSYLGMVASADFFLWSQSQLMKFFDIVIIVPVNEVFPLEILLELFPLKSPFNDLTYLLEVLQLNGCPSIQIEYGKYFLHVS